MRNQAGNNGENEEARAETCTEEATVRQKREEGKRRNRRLSSRNGQGSRRKEAEQDQENAESESRKQAPEEQLWE